MRTTTANRLFSRGTGAEHAAVYPDESAGRIPLRSLHRPTFGARDSDYNRFAERLELRYTGIKDWLFYAEGEWEEEYGNVNEFQNDRRTEVPLDKDTNRARPKIYHRRQLVSDR